MYELIQNVIRILPMLLLTVLFIYMLRFKWYARLISVVLVGWGILILSFTGKTSATEGWIY